MYLNVTFLNKEIVRKVTIISFEGSESRLVSESKKYVFDYKFAIRMEALRHDQGF